MEIVYQLMMGLSLAACAGFRATLPLFVVGIMARTGHVSLSPSYAFLASDGMLAILAIASLLEFLGDKVIAIDHFLDAVGTVARPVAGVMVASALLTKVDPSTAMLLALITGGGTAFTIHAGKAALRAKSTMLAPFHGGSANAFLSFGEDALTIGGSFLAIFAPFVAFFGTMILLGAAAILVFFGIKAGQRLMGYIVTNRVDAPKSLAVATPQALR